MYGGFGQDYEASQQLEYGCAGGFPGGQPMKASPMLRKPRRRMNGLAICLSLLLPWAMFVAMDAVTSFNLHFTKPTVCWFLVVLGLLVCLACATYALSSRLRRGNDLNYEATWMLFVTFTLFLAWILGIGLGSSNYSSNLQPHYNMMSLNTYSEVNPNRMRGQQLMDAGRVNFMQEARLDIGRSMGFKNNDVYCVAPVTYRNETVATYDFWAVGKGCCSGNAPDFHCPNFNHPNAHAGMRLMQDGDRAFYRLAVQQAEATYHIKAVHPLFFYWVDDLAATPSGNDGTSMAHEGSAGSKQFLVEMFSYLVFQAFLVACATLAFSKLGQY